MLVAIWDPGREVTISNERLHHNVDYTPYEGMKVRGWPETVVSRGEIVVDGGEMVADKGRGEFLRCDLPAPARPRAGPSPQPDRS